MSEKSIIIPKSAETESYQIGEYLFGQYCDGGHHFYCVIEDNHETILAALVRAEEDIFSSQIIYDRQFCLSKKYNYLYNDETGCVVKWLGDCRKASITLYEAQKIQYGS